MNREQLAQKAIILDRGGVLVDVDFDRIERFSSELSLSLEELEQLFMALGQTTGPPTTLEEEERFWTQFWENVAMRARLDDRAKQELFKVDIYQFLRPYPEVESVLAEVVSRGWRVGVLSNFALASIEHSLKAVGLLPYIHVALSSTLIGVRKPEPEAYLSITAALRIDPVNCLYFDDEIALVEGARDIGMKAYLVDRQSADHQLENYRVRDLTAIIDIINSTAI